MDRGEVPGLIDRDEGRERGVEPEEAVEIDRRVLRAARAGPLNRKYGTVAIEIAIAVRHHDVEAVRRAALEDADQRLLAFLRRRLRAESGLAEEHRPESRLHPDGGQGDGSALQENASRYVHCSSSLYNPVSGAGIRASRAA